MLLVGQTVLLARGNLLLLAKHDWLVRRVKRRHLGGRKRFNDAVQLLLTQQRLLAAHRTGKRRVALGVAGGGVIIGVNEHHIGGDHLSMAVLLGDPMLRLLLAVLARRGLLINGRPIISMRAVEQRRRAFYREILSLLINLIVVVLRHAGVLILLPTRSLQSGQIILVARRQLTVIISHGGVRRIVRGLRG